MPEKIEVAPLRSFTDLGNSRMLIKYDGRSIAIFYHDGDFYAVDNSCYHHGGPLLYGDIEDLAGHPCVICPWHEYKIALDSGECLYYSIDPTVPASSEQKNASEQTIRSKGRKQRVHMVVIDKGIVYVELNESQEKLESDSYAKMEVANRLEVMEHPISDNSIIHPAPTNGLKLHSNCREWAQKMEVCHEKQNKYIGSSITSNNVQHKAHNKELVRGVVTKKISDDVSNEETKLSKASNDNTKNCEEKTEKVYEQSEDLTLSFPLFCRPVSNNPLLPPSQLRRSWPCEKYTTEQLLFFNNHNNNSDYGNNKDYLNNNANICVDDTTLAASEYDIISHSNGYNNNNNNKNSNSITDDKAPSTSRQNSINQANGGLSSKLRRSASDVQFSYSEYDDCVRKSEHLYVSCFRMEKLGLNVKALYFKLVRGSIDHLPQLGELVELELPNLESKTIPIPIRRSFFITDISSYGCFFAICIKKNNDKSVTSNHNSLLYEDGLHKIVKVKQFNSIFSMDTYVSRIRQVNGQVLWLTSEMGITSAYAGMKSYFDDAIFVNNKHESLHALHLHVDKYAQDTPYLREFVRWRSQFNNMYTEKYNKSFSFVLFLTEQETPIGGDNVNWQQAILYKRQLNASDIHRAIEVKYGSCVFNTESQPATSSLIAFVCGESKFVKMAANLLRSININLDNIRTHCV